MFSLRNKKICGYPHLSVAMTVVLGKIHPEVEFSWHITTGTELFIITFPFFSVTEKLLESRKRQFIALDKALFPSKKYLYFFLFLDENICCGYSLRSAAASNEYPKQMFSLRNKRTIYLIPTVI